jgi:hypothetical protein
MKLRWSLIAAIAALSVALTFVIANIVGGTAPAATESPAAARTGASQQAAERITRPREGEQARYVGVNRNGRTALAVIVWADKVIAYVCDGSTAEVWLKGTVSDGRMILEGDNGAVLDATVQGDHLVGTAGRGQWNVKFDVRRAEAPAGVYRAGGPVGDSEVGYALIVLPSGRQTGIAWTDGLPAPAPAFDLKTATLTDKGVTFRVDPIERDQL